MIQSLFTLSNHPLTFLFCTGYPLLCSTIIHIWPLSLLALPYLLSTPFPFHCSYLFIYSKVPNIHFHASEEKHCIYTLSTLILHNRPHTYLLYCLATSTIMSSISPTLIKVPLGYTISSNCFRVVVFFCFFCHLPQIAIFCFPWQVQPLFGFSSS